MTAVSSNVLHMSKHGNGCEGCAHRFNPQGGHCYMFRDEPEVCMQFKMSGAWDCQSCGHTHKPGSACAA